CNVYPYDEITGLVNSTQKIQFLKRNSLIRTCLNMMVNGDKFFSQSKKHFAQDLATVVDNLAHSSKLSLYMHFESDNQIYCTRLCTYRISYELKGVLTIVYTT
ncbi:3713_t:CDS:1, partial [Cetraspora pellucida]